MSDSLNNQDEDLFNTLLVGLRYDEHIPDSKRVNFKFEPFNDNENITNNDSWDSDPDKTRIIFNNEPGYTLDSYDGGDVTAPIASSEAPYREDETTPVSEFDKSIQDDKTIISSSNRTNHSLTSDDVSTPHATASGQILAPNIRIDRYVIDKHLDSGGISNLYLAHHVYLKTKVVLKILRPDFPQSSANIFFQEAKTLAQMQHAGVVRIIDASVDDGYAYIILEHLKGQNLRHQSEEMGAMPPRRVLDMLEEVGKVLQRQEQLGIVHCDIKPSNIWSQEDGSFRVIDYGIAQNILQNDTSSHSDNNPFSMSLKTYTPAYASPEQLSDIKIDHRSDIFSLGLIAWEMITGQRIAVDDLRAIVDTKQRPEVPAVREVQPGCPEELAILIDGMTEHNPANRYQSSSEMLRQLEAYRYQGEIPDPPYEGSVFVALPFREQFDPVYKVIEKVCKEYRLEARRMDRMVMIDDIWGQIVQEMDASRIVIADFSPADMENVNPNVITEAAHARAIKKPLIVLSQGKPELIPFDWRHFQILQYTSDEKGLELLENDLAERLRFTTKPG